LSLLIPEKGGKLRSPLKKDDDFRGYVFDEPALTLLENVLPLWQEPCNKSLFDINNDVMYPLLKEKYAINLSPNKSGKAKEFAESTKFIDLIQSSQIRDDTDQIRTIHKAKGSESNIVLVCLEDENDFLRHFIDRNTENEEELRIGYVAASRAIERLYIHVPNFRKHLEGKRRVLA
jgi:DNA helicase-2/ATP-dependent DNA helicase PcrA